MKTLIALLLLFPCMMWGQEYEYWIVPFDTADSIINHQEDIDFLAGEDVDLEWVGNEIRITPKPKTIESELLDLLTTYEGECYADGVYIEKTAEWEHREPTLTGFIKWLKER